MNDLQKYIKGYFGVPDDHLEQIASYFYEESIEKNEFYLKEDSYCNKLSLILNGHLRIYKITDNGKEITQWISVGGDFITDLSGLIFGTTSDRNIQALSEVNLYTIERRDYEKLGSIVPKWDKLEKLFIAKCFVTLENRVFSFLSMDSTQRYEHLFSYNPALFNEVPLQYLASMLGMSPETLSRIRSNS